MNQKYRKYLLKQKQNYIFLFTIIMAIPFPAFITIRILTEDFSITNQKIIPDNHVLVMVGLAALLAILTPFLMFNYKNSKKSIDLYHSLPMSRKNLLKNHLFIGFLILFISTTLAYWSGYGILYLFKNLAYESEHLFHFIRLVLMLFVMMMPSVFVIMNTGTLVDSLLYTGIVTILPFLAYSAFNIFSAANIFGFEQMGSLKYTSPLVAIYQIINFSSEQSSQKLLFYWLVIAAILYYISQNIYRKWPSESSETPLSNPVFFPFISSVFTSIVLVFLLSIINFPSNAKIPFLSIQNLILPFLMSYGLYTTLTIFKERSAKAMKKASKNFMILFLITISLLAAYRQTLGFGAYKKVYDVEELESIFIQAKNNSPSFLQIDDGYLLKEKEEKQIILNFQEKIIQDYQGGKLPMFSSYDHESTQIQLEFMDKNGRSIRRTYALPFDVVNDLEPLEKQSSILYQNHPILNPKYTLKTLRISDDLITQEYLFIADLSILQKYIREDMKNIDIHENSSEILYHLFYEDEISYQFPIDQRFQKTIQYLEENMHQSRSIENEYMLVPKNNALASNLGYITLIQQTETAWPEESLDLSRKDIEKYRRKLRSRNVDGETHDSLMITNEDYQQTIIPIQK